ncbi:hypothetical protein P6709_10530 [Jeotgalibacillus sp. ET6]|uniref:hypothetical protein n=1 Tax=Jeotgalibacillus sp. ET6 TaxID=3037260 RepID=UPI0024189543|nr:hypothetical protein [Jeotgalibacillus sp. ET6]MDG5472188.1 hypothetical protein [Jeotgalibacillus sp. ET6]
MMTLLHTVEEQNSDAQVRQKEQKKSIRQITDGLRDKGINAKLCKRVQAVSQFQA